MKIMVNGNEMQTCPPSCIMVELPVFVVEQFLWYLCFGMIIHQIPRDFTKNVKERLFYNVPENFASSIDEIFSLRV
jgi:hypothetical protein